MRHLAGRVSTLFAALLLATGCMADPETAPVPMEWSTYRIGAPQQNDANEVELQLFRTREDCRSGLGSSDVDDCVPMADRKAGQVKIAFQIKDKTTGEPRLLPLTTVDDVRVLHSGTPPRAGKVELIPHEPQRAGQLFILLIDGTHTMKANDYERLMKVYKALMSEKVVDGFFPKEVKTGVVLLKFAQGVTGLDNQAPRVITSRKEYKQVLENYIKDVPGGYTFLYDAIEYSMGDVMKEPAIDQWLSINVAEPTIVALTDGFNNERPDDTCATNADRLNELLQKIAETRSLPLGVRPTLYTVGLGRAVYPKFELDDKPPLNVRVGRVCGTFGNRRIDGDLERDGIDNSSLALLAQGGGGMSFVANSHQKLAEVFEKAAAMRYRWWEVIYAVDGFHHRRSFKTTVGLQAFARAEATVQLYPDPWLDAPSGEREPGQRWVHAAPYRRTFGLVMPLLGGLVLVSFYGPAVFNARRAVSRRAIKGKGPPSAPPGGAPPPA